MIVVHIDSSFELSGGVDGSSTGGDGERGASSSLVSSSFLEEAVRSSGREPGSPNVVGSRIINGIPIFLLKGGIRIDDSPFEPDGDDLMTAPAPRQSNFMAPRKGAGASSSSTRMKLTPIALRPPIVRRSSSTSRMPPVTVVEPQSAPLVEPTRGPVPVGRAPVVEPVPSLGAVFVDPSSEAATASAAPLVMKRKDPAGEVHKDKEASSSRSASKKARKGKEKAPSPPLPGGIFSPAFNMSDRTKFNMSSSQRALIEPLSEVELTNAMLEISTRAASLAWYLREFADRRGVDDVRAELLAEKKNSASLRSAME
ncbi:hypothetical protein LR48_Vigan01g083500 [Vigna angularis]|uniref:Uncharacterized protein n=1 Tax=Phaseolus angularis TaxID=3914 RepID=A0A0L9TL55_PHAAN|nr:hypothetical protein LR48_Vigan01g083500 [Vigna angularis]